jgi:outer membrane murein-binding lipoprotein Lpp
MDRLRLRRQSMPCSPASKGWWARSAARSSTSPLFPGRAPIVRVLVTGGGSLLRGLHPTAAVAGAYSCAGRLASGSPERVSPRSPTRPSGGNRPRPGRPDRPGAAGSESGGAQLQSCASGGLAASVPPQGPAQHVLGAAAVGVLLVAFGALNFLRVHNAQNGVNALSTSVAALNGQIPTYDKAVAVTDGLQRTKGQVTTITTSAVDWSAVVAELNKSTPVGLNLTTFTGTAQAPAAPTGPAPGGGGGQRPRRRPRRQPHGRPRRPASVGTLNVTVGGTFPAVAHFQPVAEWIDNITGTSMFEPPVRQWCHQRAVRCRHQRHVPVHALAHEWRHPRQERKVLMEQLKRFRIPRAHRRGHGRDLGLIVYAAWISPEGAI